MNRSEFDRRYILGSVLAAVVIATMAMVEPASRMNLATPIDAVPVTDPVGDVVQIAQRCDDQMKNQAVVPPAGDTAIDMVARTKFYEACIKAGVVRLNAP